MTTYPCRYGDTDRARQHYATACVASAKVLRSEGLPQRAADLEDAARRAVTHPDVQHSNVQHSDVRHLDARYPDHPESRHPDVDQDTPTGAEHDAQVPRWWR